MRTPKRPFRPPWTNWDLTTWICTLIHQPMNDYYGSWRAMEELYETVKFGPLAYAISIPSDWPTCASMPRSPPMVDQVELHPFFAQNGALETMKEFSVAPEAWGPMAEGKHGIFTHPVLTAIGQSMAKPPPRWPCGGTPSEA